MDIQADAPRIAPSTGATAGRRSTAKPRQNGVHNGRRRRAVTAAMRHPLCENGKGCDGKRTPHTELHRLNAGDCATSPRSTA
jgi:hypothetical protein